MSLVVSWPAPAADLANDPSPYLQLHADDPIQWRAWSDDTLEEARRLDRPLLLSIGYFTCHYCHVMHRESFVDAGVAELLNEAFVPVKIDRELEPVLDAWMIEFVRRTRGVAGWPLNVVLTPEGLPFYGMTYAPRDLFQARMDAVAAQWARRPGRIRALAEAGIEQLEAPARTRVALAGQAAVTQLYRAVEAQMDGFEGGLGTQAKFPRTPLLLALLRLQDTSPDPAIGSWLRATLDAMATGGLRDGIRGGFFRYTVDPGWTHPHFEKMQYDNAQLALLYLEAARHFGAPFYRAVGFDTLDFLIAHTRGRDGLYQSALSALDADGHEGGDYLWSEAELERVLGADEAARVRQDWRWDGLEELPGLFPTAVPLDDPARMRLADTKGMPPADRKTLTGWNALVLAALAEAAVQPGGERFAGEALALAELLWGRFDEQQGTLIRDARIDRLWLEDYAYLAEALLRVAVLDPAGGWSERAQSLTAAAHDRFARADGRWDLSAPLRLSYLGGQHLDRDTAVPSAVAVLLGVQARLSGGVDEVPGPAAGDDIVHHATAIAVAAGAIH
ncbi:MAG: thioredoxin domain-containing protein [Halothiobacillaceae bacterium]